MLLHPRYIKRYKDIATLLLKYNGSNMGQTAGKQFQQEIKDDEKVETSEEAINLVEDLEALGPTFVKVGQLLSSRVDLLPQAYCDALTRLQDQVEPFPFEQAKDIIEDELGTELKNLYNKFSEQPLAAASLGQVHQAQLLDGTDVVVKVQRPHIVQQIHEDMEALMEACRFIDQRTELGKKYQFSLHAEELKQAILRELDYRQECQNLQVFRRKLNEFSNLKVPKVWERLCTSRVLTMEHFVGKKLTEISPIAQIEIKGEALTQEAFEAYLKQILVDGMFHADPHPGNVLLLDNNTLGLIDFGMVAQLSPGLQEKLTRLLLMMSEGNGEEVAEVALTMSKRMEDSDRHRFCEQVASVVSRSHNASLSDKNIGQVFLEISRIAADNHIRLPSAFTILGKTLLHLEQLGKLLAPDCKPADELKKHINRIIMKQTQSHFSQGSMLASAMDMREFVESSPRRINRLLEQLVNNELSFRVDAFDQNKLTVAIQKIANRITAGLVLAAMIIASTMLMDTQTPYTLFGYPLLAILFFLAAAFGGSILVLQILFFDKSQTQA